MSRTFAAPWSWTVKIITAAVLLATAAFFLFGDVVVGSIFIFVDVLSVAVSARGYEVAPGRLAILRPGWRTILELTDLQDVGVYSGALTGSLRLFGIGGLFGFTGLFHSASLGRYWAFGTDPKRAVVLKFAKRTLVVTPDDPAAFVAAVIEAKLESRSAHPLRA